MTDLEALLNSLKMGKDVPIEALHDAWEEAGKPLILPWRRWFVGHKSWDKDVDILWDIPEDVDEEWGPYGKLLVGACPREGAMTDGHYTYLARYPILNRFPGTGPLPFLDSLLEGQLILEEIVLKSALEGIVDLCLLFRSHFTKFGEECFPKLEVNV